MLRTTALTLGFVLVAATSPRAQQPAPPLAPRANAAFMVFSVKGDKAAEFEAAWSAIRAGFARMASADARAFGETLKFYRSDSGQPAALQPLAEYTLPIDSPSSALSYNPARIVREMLLMLPGDGVLTREDADDIMRKLKESVTRIQVRPMVKIG